MAETKKFIDLSHPLSSETQIYPSDPTFEMSPHATHDRDSYCVRRLSLGTHTGTHIDAPYHFLADGKTIENVPLFTFVGEALVVDLSQDNLQPRTKITWDKLEPHITSLLEGKPSIRIVLINTGWSKAHYRTPAYLDHPYLAPEVASGLIAKGIQLVGTDTLNPDETPTEGVAEGADGFGFHKKFLGSGGIIAENLTNLEELIQAQKTVERWIVNLVPLRLVGADGSPVRAFAHNL